MVPKFIKPSSFTRQLDTHSLVTGLCSVQKIELCCAVTTGGFTFPAICIPSTGNISDHLTTIQRNSSMMDALSVDECIISVSARSREEGLTTSQLKKITEWVSRNKLRVRSFWFINNQITDLEPFAKLCASGNLVEDFHLHLFNGDLNPESCVLFLVFLLEKKIRFSVIRLEGNTGVAKHLRNRSNLLQDVSIFDEKSDELDLYNQVIVGHDLASKPGNWHREFTHMPRVVVPSQQESSRISLQSLIRTKTSQSDRKRWIQTIRAATNDASI